MRFNDNINLDPSQISDRRGAGGAIAGGGGIVGLLVLLFSVFTGTDLSGLTAGTTTEQAMESPGAAECRTGADANQRDDCRIVGVVNSVQEFWQGRLEGYTPAQTVFFEGSTQTACGSATSAVGPFYCPTDETVYIDLGFYDELRTSFGAEGGPFAEAYVIAHEYGHHVQNLTGILNRASDQSSGPTSSAVRVELMADCFAGMWARGATQTGFVTELSQSDIRDGLDAAASVGDDRIQQRSQGRVDPESWTHGSAEQRQRWFMAGYNATSTRTCDSFAVRTL